MDDYQGDYSEEVERGAALLDSHFKSREWRNEINKTELKMSSEHKCVLGQLFGSSGPLSGYEIGLSMFDLGYSSRIEEGTAAFYGFTARFDDYRYSMWGILRQAWIKVLES